MGSTSWLIEEGAEIKVKDILSKYNLVVKKCNNVGTILTKYVNVVNKWNNADSNMFATWWNASAKGDNFGGVLKYDESKKSLYYAKANDTDGEDCMKFVIQIAGLMFYSNICVPLNTLRKESGMSSEVDSKTHLKLASLLPNNTNYSNKAAKSGGAQYNGTVWSKMMKDEMGRSDFVRITLPNKKSGSKTSFDTTVIANLIDELTSALNDVETKFNEYANAVEKVVKNTDDSIWFGVPDMYTANIKSAFTSYKTKEDAYLKRFINSTMAALQASYNGSVEALNSLKSIKLS